MELTHGSSWRIAHACSVLLIGVAIVHADYPNVVLNDQPLGYWRLNESQVTIAANLSAAGTALDGEYVGGKGAAAGPSELADGTPVRGFNSQNIAYDVGGTDVYLGVDMPLLSGLSEFTMSGWFWIRDLEANRLGLFGQNDAVEFGFIQPNQLQLWTAQGGSVTWEFDPATQVPDFEWFYVAAVGTGSELQLYLNGENVQTGGTPVDGDYGSSDFPFRIGGGGIFDDTGNQFRGTLDEIAIWDVALTPEQIAAHFDAGVGAGPVGDFDGDGVVGVSDVNLLQNAIYNGSDDSSFDLDGNFVIDDDDLSVWVTDIALTWFGDADLDGVFDSADLVTVLSAGEYEDNVDENSTWDEGDWNADLDFDSGDLVAALADGGYEVPAQGAQAVPEPATFALTLLALCLMGPALRRPRHGNPNHS